MLNFSSSKISPVTLLVVVYLVIAPLSLATQWESAAQLKLLRISLCVIGGIIALSSGILGRIRSPVKSLFIFAVLYVAAAAWSEFPLQGIAYKALFASSLCFGMAYGLSLGTPQIVRANLRLLAIVAIIAAAITWYQYLRNPGANAQLGRLAVFGINANAVGMTAAGYLLLTVYSAVNDKGFWRIFGGVGTGLLTVLLIATGSRGAIALGILGSAIQLVPFVRKPTRLIVPAAMVAIILLALSAQLPVEVVERITDFEKNTRAGMWQAGIRLFLQEPVIGHGWFSSSGRSTGNLQNVYLQVLSETGIVGGIALLSVLISLMTCVRQSYGRLTRELQPHFWLAMAVLCGLALHGFAESALILGSTVNTFLFGFGVGILESLSYQDRRTAVQSRGFFQAGSQIATGVR